MQLLIGDAAPFAFGKRSAGGKANAGCIYERTILSYFIREKGGEKLLTGLNLGSGRYKVIPYLRSMINDRFKDPFMREGTFCLKVRREGCSYFADMISFLKARKKTKTSLTLLTSGEPSFLVSIPKLQYDITWEGKRYSDG